MWVFRQKWRQRIFISNSLQEHTQKAEYRTRLPTEYLTWLIKPVLLYLVFYLLSALHALPTCACAAFLLPVHADVEQNRESLLADFNLQPPPFSLALFLSLRFGLCYIWHGFLIALHSGAPHPFCIRQSVLKWFITGQQTRTTERIFQPTFITFLGFSPHEPSMWPALSMHISTGERAFFGFASTWHHPGSKLLAITPTCFGKLRTWSFFFLVEGCTLL